MPKERAGRARLFWTAALALAAVIWVVFAYGAAPAMISKVYRGESLAVFNRLITGQANHSLAEYIADWKNFANKVSFGLGVLAACALFALGLGAGEPAEAPAESASVVGMSSKRLLIVYALGSIIFGGAAADLLRDTEHWPFSQYPMFSQIQQAKTYSMLRLYGVLQHSPLVEMPLDDNLYLQPFDNSRLPPALRHALAENRLDEGVTDCLTRYEALRRAKLHKGPPLVAMRLYRLTWTLDSTASNVDRPDAKELLTEVPPRREGGD
jgi:hypothetical protein